MIAGAATFQFADLIELDQATPNPDTWLFCAWVKLGDLDTGAALTINGESVATAEQTTDWQFICAEINILDCAGAEFGLSVSANVAGFANFDDVWMCPKDLAIQSAIRVWPGIYNMTQPPVCDGGLLVW